MTLRVEGNLGVNTVLERQGYTTAFLLGSLKIGFKTSANSMIIKAASALTEFGVFLADQRVQIE